MRPLFYGIALFSIAFLLHLILWKIRLPRNQTKALLYIFSGCLAAGSLILWRFPGHINFFGISAPRLFFDYLQLGLLFSSLSLAYIVTYSALEVDSPSLKMILDIAGSGRGGMPDGLLSQKMNDDILIRIRVNDLVCAGLIGFDGRVYKIKPKGSLLAQIFIGFRGLLRKPVKGG